jgi:sirohydrochlorin cobaltochelatase
VSRLPVDYRSNLEGPRDADTVNAAGSGGLLVLFAHGSTDAGWRRPFEHLRDSLGDRARLAYMESCAPSLEDVAGEAASRGIARIVVLPLFLSAGVHVRRDVGAAVDAIRARHPELTVELLEPVGQHPRLVEALRDIAAAELGRIS